MRLLAALLLVLAFPANAQSKGDIEVRQPWSRATPAGASVAVGYLEIRNRGAQPERLLSISTPLAKSVEMHVTERDGDVTRMRQVESFAIPARERAQLRPGGAHLMLIGLQRPLKEGERVPMRLRFERAGELAIELEVQELGSRQPGH